MCEFFSALVLRNGDLIHDAATDSHTDLIDAFGLDKVENTGCQHFAKIEFTPSSKETMDEIDTYTLRVDESTEPIWFSEVKDIVIQKCRSIVSRMIIIGEHKCILSGKYILGKNANVRKVVNSNIIAMLGSSQVGVMRESSQVGEMWGSSQVGEMWGSSQVGVMWGSSNVGEMRGSSNIENDNRAK